MIHVDRAPVVAPIKHIEAPCLYARTSDRLVVTPSSRNSIEFCLFWADVDDTDSEYSVYLSPEDTRNLADALHELADQLETA